jgi:gamma-glutamylaminecyclotransferase
LSEFTTGQISTNLFVYGNIKKGFENHHLLENSEFIGEGVLKKFGYKETNSQNFGMIIRNSKPYLFSKDDCLPKYCYNIKGEVYKISVKDLRKFSFLEEQDYIKTEIRVEVDKEEKLYAIAFIANFTIQYSADELLEEFKN